MCCMALHGQGSPNTIWPRIHFFSKYYLLRKMQTYVLKTWGLVIFKTRQPRNHQIFGFSTAKHPTLTVDDGSFRIASCFASDVRWPPWHDCSEGTFAPWNGHFTRWKWGGMHDAGHDLSSHGRRYGDLCQEDSIYNPWVIISILWFAVSTNILYLFGFAVPKCVNQEYFL